MGKGKQHGCERAGIWLLCTLVLAALAPAAQAAGPNLNQFTFDIAASSDYVVYGVTRSQSAPTVQAQVGWMSDSGWLAGAWASTLNLNPGPGPNYEIDPYLGKRWTLGADWSARTEVTRYIFRPGLQRLNYDYTELRSSVSYRDTLDLAVAWSPDYSAYSAYGPARAKTMLAYEASTHFPATRWLAFNAGLGRRDLAQAFKRSYWYWSAGAEAAANRFSLAVSYIGTSDEATDLFGADYAGDRVVATVALRLR